MWGEGGLVAGVFGDHSVRALDWAIGTGFAGLGLGLLLRSEGYGDVEGC